MLREDAPMGMPDLDLSAMTVEERLELTAKLWDSLQESDVPRTTAQREELARRAADIEVNPQDQMPWEEVRDRILGSGGKPGLEP